MNIVIFSGTTEGRKISEYLTSNQIHHIVCVATNSGEFVMEKSIYADIRVDRLNEKEIEAFLGEIEDACVIDATHPYAKEVTENIIEACNRLSVKYVRVKRIENDFYSNASDDIHYYENMGEFSNILSKLEGNILLTTGSKELKLLSIDEGLKEKVYVRVLPNLNSIKLCNEAGIDEKHILAMYGPHSEELNIAIIKQYNIRHIVTKSSGSVGGFEEKVKAARQEGCTLHIIKRPQEDGGITVSECIWWLADILHSKIVKGSVKLKVSLVGVGMGDTKTLTIEGSEAIKNADILFGASRMIEKYQNTHETVAIYTANEIISFLENRITNCNKCELKVSVLFSGDTGIYSGASKLYASLMDWGKCSEIKIIPGISSFSAFAAALGVDYSGARLESIHGKSDDIPTRERLIDIACSGRDNIFLLMSGKEDFIILKDILANRIDGNTGIDIGYMLSYPEQQIIHSTLEGMIDDIADVKDGLFIIRIRMKMNE